MKYIVLSLLFLFNLCNANAQTYGNCKVILKDGSIIDGRLKLQTQSLRSNEKIILSKHKLKLIPSSGGIEKIVISDIDSLILGDDVYQPIVHEQLMKVGPDRGKVKKFTKLGKRLVNGQLVLYQVLEVQMGTSISVSDGGVTPFAGSSGGYVLRLYFGNDESSVVPISSVGWKSMIRKRVDCFETERMLDSYSYKELAIVISEINASCF